MSTVLKTEAITMRFGGVTAVNELKLDIKEHQIVALIGPNGAGKTTAFNMITGVYTPTEGKVKYTAPGKDEVDITGKLPSDIAKMGIARTFQNIRTAAPIALSSVVLNLSNLIDDTTIRTRLKFALDTGYDVIKEMYSEALTLSGTLDEGIANYLYGTHGSVLNIKNLIPTITLTLGISAIPALTAAWANKNKQDIKVTVESTLRVTMMIAMPAGFGIAALARPILDLLYHSESAMFDIAEPLLIVYGFGLFLFAATSPMTNMLQAVGRMDIPIKSIFVGSCAKIILNFILIGNPAINIKGAPVSTTVCYIIIFAINLTSLLKVTKVKINFVSVYLKPLVCGLLCGIVAFASNWLIVEKLAIQSRLVCIVSVGLGGLTYAISMLIFKGIVKDDVLMLPKGEKIAKVLAKFGFLG